MFVICFYSNINTTLRCLVPYNISRRRDMLHYRPSRLPRDGAAAKASVIVAPWRSGWDGDSGLSTNTVASSSVFEGQPWKRAHACATSLPRADEP